MYRLTASRQRNHGRQRGYTLVELSLVALILGIMAAAVIPALTSPDSSKLDLAAREYADIISYARSEAIRQGLPIGFQQKFGPQRFRLFTANTATTPWTRTFDIYHPVSKKLYDFKFENHPFAAVDTIVATPIYRGTCVTEKEFYFDAQGTAHCLDPHGVPLESLLVTLTLGDLERQVELDGITGQVSVQ